MLFQIDMRSWQLASVEIEIILHRAEACVQHHELGAEEASP